MGGVNFQKKMCRRHGKKSKFLEEIYSMFNPLTGRYQCPRCDKTYSGKNGLGQHYQIHVGKFNYWCDLCARGFTVKTAYEAHVAKHEGRTFPCDLCYKRFYTKEGLRRHNKEHKNAQIFM